MTPKEKLKKLRDELFDEAIEGEIISILCKDGKIRYYKIRDYAELCIKTEAIRAQAQSTVNIALEYNSEYVQVSRHYTNCDICKKYDGKVFSVIGGDPDFPFYDDFIPAHPHCKHTLTVIFREIIDKYGVENYK